MGPAGSRTRNMPRMTPEAAGGRSHDCHTLIPDKVTTTEW